VASEVELDPMFGPLVRDLRAGGAEVTVVSDGFGFYVQDACAPFDVPVLTNTVDFATGRLEFPHEDRCCPCTSCGVCKQAPIKDAHHRGRTTVLVGDGVSDRKAALLADVVFAKDALAGGAPRPASRSRSSGHWPTCTTRWSVNWPRRPACEAVRVRPRV
jgi:2-hydroxy-3-keto-5-methylthiopentenyl-1-phosphate phosphatase